MYTVRVVVSCSIFCSIKCVNKNFQVETIFTRIRFFDRFPITLRLAGVTPIFRVQDCPLKMPILRDIHREWHQQRQKLAQTLDANCTSVGMNWRTSVGSNVSAEIDLDDDITFAVINATSGDLTSNETVTLFKVVRLANNMTSRWMNNMDERESEGEDEGESVEEIARFEFLKFLRLRVIFGG